MKKIQNIIARFELLKNDLDNNITLIKTIHENEEIIIDMNVQEQLYEKGENSLGVSISDYAPYSPFTLQIKREKGQPTDRVTLKDEGDFYNSFYISIDSDFFSIKASDEKTAHLMKKYGKDIFGLTQENKDEFITAYFKPNLEKAIKKYMNG